MCGGFWNNPIQSISDTVSAAASNPTLQAIVAPSIPLTQATSKVVAGSPLAQAAITVGGAALGVPPSVTAAVLAANSAAHGQSLQQVATTGVLSYLGGSGAANYMNTGSLFGNAASTLGASGMGGGTGLTLGAGGQTGLTLGGTGASTLGAGLGDYTLGSSLGSGMTGSGLGGSLATLGSMGGGSGLTVGGLGDYVLGSSLGGAGLLSTGANLAGGYLNNQAAADAATKQADAQIRAAQIAADAAKFRPVGVKTNFGESKFGFDAAGNLNSAGYTLDPRLQAQQNQLMGASGGMLDQFTGSQAATAPMGTAAQRMMSLGNQYLQTDPQSQAAMYMQQQQGLLAPGRASTMADLQAQMQAQGRGGFAIGGGVGGQGAANPQMQALYNAQLQQDALLASQATQGGMDYAKFGGAFVGAGGNMMRDMYGTQVAAYDPYKTALGGAQQIEGLGQNALTQGISLGNTATAANARAGELLGNGMTNAANTIGSQAAQAGSLWGNILQGGAQELKNYKWGT